MITVLGGGPAGLATAWYARRAGESVHLYEAAPQVGGNCRTLSLGAHRFDTGAHRLHDCDSEITAEILSLLRGEIARVSAPSRVMVGTRMLGFPLRPLDMVRRLPAVTVARIVAEIIAAAVRRDHALATGSKSFLDAAIGTYGATLAGMLLIPYTEKLWGAPASSLSSVVSGGRLKGLDLRTFLAEIFPRGESRATRHLDGTFLYPTHGIGAITERLAQEIGSDAISLCSPVTRIYHDGITITGIETSNGAFRETENVVSTLPLPIFLRALEPAPPPQILRAASDVRFRDLRILALVLDRPSYSANASIYFPDSTLPFTRIYEPSNRSRAMSPESETLIVVEVPVSKHEPLSAITDTDLYSHITGLMHERGLLNQTSVIDWSAHRLSAAYPILEIESEQRLREITNWLDRFGNLHLSGRNALFRYSHIHDMFRMGRSTVESIVRSRLLV